MKKILFSAGSLAVLGACASTDPGGGASIQYYLPKTNVAASLTMIMEKCPDANGKNMELDSKLSLAASAGADATYYQVDGKDLASVRTKRNVTINVDKNGVISGVNASVEDRTSAIISNTIGTVTKLIGLGAPPPGVTTNDPGARLQCRTEISNAIAQVASLKAEIARLRAELTNSANPTRRSELLEDINALAFELARLRTGPLTQTLTANIDTGTSAPATSQGVTFDYAELREKWFVVPMVTPPSPGPGVPPPPATAAPLTDANMDFLFGVSWSASNITPTPGLSPAPSKTLGSCKLAMYVPAQTRARFELSPYGAAIQSSKQAKAATPIAQWGNPDTLCLSARFAENRTVNVSFTPFGQRKSLTWTSAARGEAVTSALSGLAENAASLNTSLEGPTEQEKQQETINNVDRLLKYNAARLCEEAAKAGATSCPEPSSD